MLHENKIEHIYFISFHFSIKPDLGPHYELVYYLLKIIYFLLKPIDENKGFVWNCIIIFKRIQVFITIL